jgi:hypothetical protein
MHSSVRVIIAGCPKPFIEPFNIVQKNAIKSWKNVKHESVSNVRIIILGDEEGVEDFCKETECEHDKDLKYNKYGTPLVNNIFEKIKTIGIEEETKYPEEHVVCCYINCDIVIFNEFLENIVSFVHSHCSPHSPHSPQSHNILNDPWLLVGTRWDVDGVYEIDYEESNWEERIKKYAKENGVDHGCGGIDYFIFSPQTYDYIYPFALGKFVWDRWLVGNVFRRDSTTVDISLTNFIVHQNSPWYQVARGKGNEITLDRKEMFKTDEVEMNQLFDFYEKDVYSGTRIETKRMADGSIKFIKKSTIPRMYE